MEFSQRGTDTRLPTEYEAAAYRIVQEALTNVARHAHATSCRVGLDRDADTLEITVTDNGVGFNPEADTGTDNTRRGLGLLGIRERVARLQGTCRIESGPGHGTRIMASIPLRRSIDTGGGERRPVTPLTERFADA